MKRTLYPLTAGVYTAIPALQFARRVDLEEDGSTAPAGILLKFREDNFTQIFEYLPAQQPCILGDRVAQANGRGYILGWPTQTGLNARAADNYVMASAVTGTTTLRVTEYD
jgi:hypothetical protein